MALADFAAGVDRGFIDLQNRQDNLRLEQEEKQRYATQQERLDQQAAERLEDRAYLRTRDLELDQRYAQAREDDSIEKHRVRVGNAADRAIERGVDYIPIPMGENIKTFFPDRAELMLGEVVPGKGYRRLLSELEKSQMFVKGNTQDYLKRIGAPPELILLSLHAPELAVQRYSQLQTVLAHQQRAEIVEEEKRRYEADAPKRELKEWEELKESIGKHMYGQNWDRLRSGGFLNQEDRDILKAQIQGVNEYMAARGIEIPELLRGIEPEEIELDAVTLKFQEDFESFRARNAQTPVPASERNAWVHQQVENLGYETFDDYQKSVEEIENRLREVGIGEAGFLEQIGDFVSTQSAELHRRTYGLPSNPGEPLSEREKIQIYRMQRGLIPQPSRKLQQVDVAKLEPRAPAPLDVMYSDMPTGPSLLDRMQTDLTEEQQRALRGAQQTINVTGGAALASPALIPAVGFAAGGLPGAVSSILPVIEQTLLRITPDFISKASGAMLLAEHGKLNRTLGLIRAEHGKLNRTVGLMGRSKEQQAARDYLSTYADSIRRVSRALGDITKRLGELNVPLPNRFAPGVRRLEQLNPINIPGGSFRDPTSLVPR